MASQQPRPIWFPIGNHFVIKMVSWGERGCNMEGQSITSPFFVTIF